MISACSSYNPDLEEASAIRAENRINIRNSIGCQFLDDHAAYRECILNTYKKSTPKTFVPAVDTNGKSIAIVSSGEVKPTAIELLPEGSGDQTPVVASSVAVQPVQEQPVQAQPVQTQPSAPIAQPLSGEYVQVSPCMYQTTELYEGVMQPCVVNPTPVAEVPQTVTITTTETVTEKPVEVIQVPEPEPEKTWWETYQEQPAEAPKVVCPCPDPNDPCPQCVTK